ncbi:hypothetical protein BC830DRAFT_1163089 [Chytriomyces sp. MP71]|nr:hypothetical protein BC830DRAFT_1163089 [Chytriomyces sp. MP71]
MSPQDLLRRQPAPQQLPTMHKFVFASHYDAPSHVVPCQPHVVLIPSFLPSKSNTIAQYASQIPSFPYRRIHHAPISPSQSPIQFVLPSNGHCASVQYIPAAQALQYHLPRVESQVQDLWLRNTQLDSPSRRSSWESVCTVPSTPIPPPAAAAEEGRESNKTAISFLVD